MTPQIKAGLTDLTDMLAQLENRLDLSSQREQNAITREAIVQVVATIDNYRRAVKTAHDSSDDDAALRAVNRTTSVNKGLSNEGSWITREPELLTLGDNISTRARELARGLRHELGLDF